MNTRYLAWILPISCRKEKVLQRYMTWITSYMHTVTFSKMLLVFLWIYEKKLLNSLIFATKMNLNFLPIFYGIRYVVCLYKLMLWLCGGSTKPKSSTYVILFYLQIGVGTFNFYAKKCPHTCMKINFWKNYFSLNIQTL